MRREDDGIGRASFLADPLASLLTWLMTWLYVKPQAARYWWRFRHNPAPGPLFKAVQDGQGRTYWLEQKSGGINEIAFWHLDYRGERVAEANGLRLGGQEDFTVGNLEVDPAHQGRGLGRLLLERIEAEARRQGAAVVSGRVVAKDAAAFPGLLAWYHARGYDVQAVEAEPKKGGTHDVAHIRKAVE